MIVTVKPSEGTLGDESPECHLTYPGSYSDICCLTNSMCASDRQVKFAWEYLVFFHRDWQFTHCSSSQH